MASIAATYLPTIWAQESLIVLRDNLVMAGLVHRSFESAIGTAGDRVRTRLPNKHVVHTWTGQTGTAAEATEDKRIDLSTASNLTIVVDSMAYTSNLIQDSDASMSIKDLVAEFIVPMIDPLSQGIDDAIMTEFTSTASTDVNGLAVEVVAADLPVSNGQDIDEQDLIEAMLQLNLDQAPQSPRRLVLSAQHHAQIVGRPLFHQANTAGETRALRDAIVGRAFGFDVYMSQNVPGAIDTNGSAQSIAFHPNALALVTRNLDTDGPNQNGARAARAEIDNISVRVMQQYMIQKNGTAIVAEVLYGTQLMDARLAKIINP